MTECTDSTGEKPLNRFGEMEVSISPGHKGAIAPLKFDADEYRGELEDCDLTIEQQDEMLRALWDIVVTMVDIGFGLDSAQLALSNFTDALAEIGNAESQYGKNEECKIFNENASNASEKGSGHDT